MSVGNFNTSNQTYRQLMGNGLIFSVPLFQRDYSWPEEDWEALWSDIQNLFGADPEPAHYMGYLVLQSGDNKKFNIIDGQQRLATLSIIVLAVLKNFDHLIEENIEPENNRLRKEQLRSSFIGYLDPVSLIPQSKLNLNRNNNSFYQNYLVPLQQSPTRGLKNTEQRMRKAFVWFEDKVRQIYTVRKNGALLAEFLDKLSDKLFFTVITVNDELNAYKVFETLNARGVKLSSTDLLKNHLFSVVHRERGDDLELNALDERWEVLVSKLGSESFPEFLRAHWNSRNKMVRSADLFKTIKSKVVNRQQVFELLRNMEIDADPYSALSQPEDSFWSVDRKVYIRELILFEVRQLYPLILSGYRNLNDHEFTSLLRVCSIITFRYNTIGSQPTNEQELVYTSIAEKIHSGGIKDMHEIWPLFRSIYPNDQVFTNFFTEKQFKTTYYKNKKILRYILFKIEHHLSNVELDRDSSQFSIEHILPESAGTNWPNFSDNDQELFLYRIGNMTLLLTNENRDLGNVDFVAKQQVYANSKFEITRRIAQNNAEWTIDRIVQRQKWMAEQAKTIWRISQLS